MLLGHGVELIHRAAAHQAEVAGVWGNGDVGQLFEKPVKQMRRGFLEFCFALSADAAPIDHVEAFIHPRHHLAEQFRRILKVAIEDEDAIPPAQVQASRKGELVSVVARQVHRDDVGVPRGEVAQNVPGAVGRSIVDDHQLVAIACAGPARISDPAMQFGQGFAFVETGNDDGDAQGFHSCRP